MKEKNSELEILFYNQYELKKSKYVFKIDDTGNN